MYSHHIDIYSTFSNTHMCDIYSMFSNTHICDVYSTFSNTHNMCGDIYSTFSNTHIICDLLLGFLENGIMVTNGKKLAKHYIKSCNFKTDVFSLLPTDLLYLAVGLNPLVRLNRICRVSRLMEFFDRTIRHTT